MKGVDMYYAVKVLIEQGKSIAGIAKELGIDRKTVRKIRDKVRDSGVKTPVMIRGANLTLIRMRLSHTLKEDCLQY